MGANCSTCNCDRGEIESEVKLEHKGGDAGKKVMAADQNKECDDQHFIMNDLVRLK